MRTPSTRCPSKKISVVIRMATLLLDGKVLYQKYVGDPWMLKQLVFRKRSIKGDFIVAMRDRYIIVQFPEQIAEVKQQIQRGIISAILFSQWLATRSHKTAKAIPSKPSQKENHLTALLPRVREPNQLLFLQSGILKGSSSLSFPHFSPK